MIDVTLRYTGKLSMDILTGTLLIKPYVVLIKR